MYPTVFFFVIVFFLIATIAKLLLFFYCSQLAFLLSELSWEEGEGVVAKLLRVFLATVAFKLLLFFFLFAIVVKLLSFIIIVIFWLM